MHLSVNLSKAYLHSVTSKSESLLGDDHVTCPWQAKHQTLTGLNLSRYWQRFLRRYTPVQRTGTFFTHQANFVKNNVRCATSVLVLNMCTDRHLFVSRESTNCWTYEHNRACHQWEHLLTSISHGFRLSSIIMSYLHMYINELMTTFLLWWRLLFIVAHA